MEHIAAVDLHSDNGYFGIIDSEGKRVYQKRLPNKLPVILNELAPYSQMLRCVIIESTYNWYWLGDGLMKNGYSVKLANPAKFDKYNDLKNTNDKSDTFFLTELERLGILPTGYIYPKQDRGIRDLLRRRMLLVQQKTTQTLSFQSLISRHTGGKISANGIRAIDEEGTGRILEGEDSYVVFSGQNALAVIKFLQERIRLLEKKVLADARLKKEFEKLQTIPGIGKILSLVIMYEVGDINRFKSPGNFVSFCRCVKSTQTSNNKKKGSGNRKNGNKYLSWAYVEAANFCKRFCPEAKKYYQRKLSKGNSTIATKSLAAKLCRASYYIMRDQVDFDVKKMFG